MTMMEAAFLMFWVGMGLPISIILWKIALVDLAETFSERKVEER